MSTFSDSGRVLSWVLALGSVLSAPPEGLAQDSSADEVKSKHVIGYTLPNFSNRAGLVEFADVRVEGLEAYGCAEDLAWALRLGVELVSDPSCALIYTAAGDELTAVAPANLIYGPNPMSCGHMELRLSREDFVAVYNGLAPRGIGHGQRPPGDPPPPQTQSQSDDVTDKSPYDQSSGCKLTGEVCVSPDGASFSVACDDRVEITVSTDGAISIAGRVGDLSVGYEVPASQ